MAKRPPRYWFLMLKANACAGAIDNLYLPLRDDRNKSISDAAYVAWVALEQLREVLIAAAKKKAPKP